MKRMGTLLAMSLAALNAGALEVQPSPYDKIAERNLFQLQAAAIKETAKPEAKPLPKVTLRGILTILGKPLALITIEGIKSQPVESVRIGERQAIFGVEVTGIDERAGVVTILNGDESQILNFEPAKSPGPEPVRDVMPPPAPVSPSQALQETTLTPEEQTALIELQRLKYQQEGNPIQAILPPTGVDLQR